MKNPTKTVNLVCVLLMAVLVLLQFTPYWSVDGEGVSLMGYLGFPDDHSNLSSWLNSSIPGGFNINEIVFWVFFTAVLCIAGVILCLKFRESAAAALVPAAAGILGILFCVIEPAFRLGNLWVVYLLLYVALLALSLVPITGLVKEIVKDFRE